MYTDETDWQITWERLCSNNFINIDNYKYSDLEVYFLTEAQTGKFIIIIFFCSSEIVEL